MPTFLPSSFKITYLSLILTALIYTGCTNNSNTAPELSSQTTGKIRQVTLGFGTTSSNGPRGLVSQTQQNDFSAKNLVIQTIAVCGGEVETIVRQENPATNIPVCESSYPNYPRLMQVDVAISRPDGSSRTYTLNLTKSDMPAELELKRVEEKDGTIKYTITDKGIDTVINLNLITKFLDSGLAIEYIDKDFLKSVSTELLSDAVVKVVFSSCVTCIVVPENSVLPNGIKFKEILTGAALLDTTLAVTGSYSILLAVKGSVEAKDLSKATVILNIKREPVVIAPVANPLSVNVEQDGEATITLLGTDSKNQPLTYSLIISPKNGDLVGTAPNLTYKPHAMYFGKDSFTFKVNNGKLDSESALVSIEVKQSYGKAHDGSITVEENTPFSGVLSADPSPGDEVHEYQIVSKPLQGTLQITDSAKGTFNYTPNFDSTLNDFFTFRTWNGLKYSNVATISVTVHAGNFACQAGSLDTSFNGTGVVQTEAAQFSSSSGPFGSLFVKKDGVIYIGGAQGVGKYLPTGTADSSFGTAGFKTLNFEVSGIQVFENQIFVGGSRWVTSPTGSTSPVRDGAMLDNYGSLDSNFTLSPAISGQPSYQDANLHSVSPLSSGFMLFWDAGAVAYLANGQIDTSLGINGFYNRSGYSVGKGVVTPEGSVVLAQYLSGSSIAPIELRKFLKNGQPDSNFGTNGIASISYTPSVTKAWGYKRHVIQLKDGSLLVFGGTYYVASQSLDNIQTEIFLARFEANGSPRLNFGNNGLVQIPFGAGTGSALSVVELPSGELALAATRHCVPGYMSGTVCPDEIKQSGITLLKYSATGSPVASWGNNGRIAIPYYTQLNAYYVAPKLAIQGKRILVTTAVNEMPFKITLRRYCY